MLTIVPLFIGTTELLLIGGIALLLFGGKKLPELMNSMGKGVRKFKEGMQDLDYNHEEDTSQQSKEQQTNYPDSTNEKADDRN